MSVQKRTILFGLVVLAQCLYFPINRWMGGRVAFKTPLDPYIPSIAIFALPYLLSLPF